MIQNKNIAWYTLVLLFLLTNVFYVSAQSSSKTSAQKEEEIKLNENAVKMIQFDFTAQPNNKIEKMLEAFPQTLTSIKGIGNIYAAGITAEIGDINRFPSQASLAKYAGLVWTQHQSSDFEAEDKRMIQVGNHHLKYYLCEAANALRRCDPEFKRFYALKYKEANKHNHKRALALSARKLVRLVYTLLKTNRLYIPPEEY